MRIIVFGIAEGCEGPQQRTLRQVDSAWETQRFPCEVPPQRYGEANGMVEGWAEKMWWINNVESLINSLDYDDDDEWELSRYCGRLITEAKLVNDRSVVGRIKEALRLHQATKRITVDEFVLVDILAAMKGL